jgi:hypothetical protein
VAQAHVVSGDHGYAGRVNSVMKLGGDDAAWKTRTHPVATIAAAILSYSTAALTIMEQLMNLLHVQSQQIKELTLRLSQLENNNNNTHSSTTALPVSNIVELNQLSREQRRMSKLLQVLERQQMANSDLKEDVELLKKNDSSHRYDLRLLKASVGELISADRSYSLEVEQSVGLARQMLREAFGEQRTYLTREISETVKLEVLNIIEARLATHLESSSTAAAEAADSIILRATRNPDYHNRKRDNYNKYNDHIYSIQNQNTRNQDNHARNNTNNMSQRTKNDPFLNNSRARGQNKSSTMDELDTEFDADGVELEMDLLRLEERIKEVQRSALSTSRSR